jgi:hypothetical protein
MKKTTKKPQPKPVKKTETVTASETSKVKLELSKTNKKWFVIAAITIGVLGLLFYFKNLFIAAMVNGQPIFRVAIVKQLEKNYGRQTLDYLTSKVLIEQEANKQKVVVSPAEIEEEIKKVEEELVAQGQTLDQVLLLQSMSREDLADQIKISKLVEKLSTSETQVSAEEVAEYIDTNQDFLPTDLQGEELENYVATQLSSQKQNQATQTWLMNLKQGAKIQNFMEY